VILYEWADRRKLLFIEGSRKIAQIPKESVLKEGFLLGSNRFGLSRIEFEI
jgi:hypothetical protein